MARRKRNPGILEVAFAGDWKVSMMFAGAMAYLTFFVAPGLTNPLLKVVAQALRPVGLILIVLLLIAALVKVFSAKNQQRPDWRVDPEAPPGLDAKLDKLFEAHQPVTAKAKPTEWSADLIKDLEWKRFEELSTAYYEAKGIRAEATKLGADGGIDIKLYQDGSGTPTSIVQCKAWNARYVGVKEIREFLGVMTHEKIAKGFYMTSGEYSDDAKEVAKANGITLINGGMLMMMIQRLPAETQQSLLAAATEGDYTTPTCSACGIKMLTRTGKRGNFWGCANYPRCRQMLHMRAGATMDNVRIAKTGVTGVRRADWAGS